jgi:hypothetical protein
MPDPDLLEATEYEYYKQTHPPRLTDYSKRTPEELAHDVTVLHDFLKKLVREKDVIRKTLIAERKASRLWRKLLVFALLGTWAGIGGAIKIILPILAKCALQ